MLLIKGSFAFFIVAFFGIPTVNALFVSGEISTLITVYLGSALYGNTIGYLQVAQTRLSKRDAFLELLKIPYLYVFVLAIGIKILAIDIPDEAEPVMDIMGWIVSAAGMTIVGLHLTEVDFKNIRILYFLKLLLIKTFSAILLLAIILGAEYFILGQLEETDYRILALLPFFPIASNISLFASFLETEEERFALLVFISIVFSMLLVPIAAQFI